MSRGVQAKGSFSIKQNARSFEILSSSLYSDSITSIIRELSANAVDAHRAAGTLDTKFIVHIPTSQDREFRIRDFGTGMSVDKVALLYTTYFESDKNDSDDDIGGFGLGSKSPFSYTKSFSLTSFYQGIKYCWVAAVGREGYPEINLMHSEPTEEHDGIEIKFAVTENYYDWESKAAQVFKWFTYKPTCNVHIPTIECMMDGGWWKVKKDNASVLIMGGIAYPVSSWTNLIVYCNLGDVEMTPSRESLKMTDETRIFLSKTHKKVLEEINKQLEDKFAACKTRWEAITSYDSVYSPVPHTLRSIKPAYKGIELKLTYEFPEGTIKHTKNSYKEKFDKTKLHSSSRLWGRMKFFYADSSYHLMRVKEYVLKNPGTEAVVIPADNKGEDSNVKNLMNYLELPISEAIYTSSLPKPTIGRTYEKKTQFSYRCLSPNQSGTWYDHTSISIDLEEFEAGGLYIQTKSGLPTIGDLGDVQVCLSMAGFKEDVIIVNQIQAGKFAKHADWKEITGDFLVKLLEREIPKNPATYGWFLFDSWKNSSYNVLERVAHFCQKQDFKDFVGKVQALDAAKPAGIYKNHFVNCAQLEIVKDNPLNKEWAELVVKYPILNLTTHIDHTQEAYKIFGELI